MKERAKELNLYQKIIVLVSIAMVLVFSVLYPMTISRKGFLYKDTVLLRSEENGVTRYSGKIQKEQAVFTVEADKTVTFQHGTKTYGPYTATEDPTAIPEKEDLAEQMTGLELRCGDKLLFRGGLLKISPKSFWLYNEDGSVENIRVVVGHSDGSMRDENGGLVDPMEPSVSTVLQLMDGPELTHKGEVQAWLAGLLFSAMTILSILFADEMFRWNLRFQIRNVDDAEPSEWELMGRYMGWTLVPIMTLVLFIMGLK